MLNATFSVIFKLCENFKKSDDWDMSAETIFRTILLQAFSDVDLSCQITSAEIVVQFFSLL